MSAEPVQCIYRLPGTQMDQDLQKPGSYDGFRVATTGITKVELKIDGYKCSKNCTNNFFNATT